MKEIREIMSDTNAKRRRRILGLPVPVIAALLAVLVGGTAWAAIFFYGRISGQVRPDTTPTITWGTSTATGSEEGAKCTLTGGGSDNLQVDVRGYAGGSCEFAAVAKTSSTATVRVEGIDLGSKLEAELVGAGERVDAFGLTGFPTGTEFAGVGDVVSSAATPGVPVRVRVTIPEGLDGAAIPLNDAVGLILAPVIE